MDHRQIGRSVPRKEGREKVTGRARYIDDLHSPDTLFGVTVRSSVPRGILRKIHFDPGVPWEGIVVVTAADIPGKNSVLLLSDDQPCLAASQINHPEEPIVLLAHSDKYLLERARQLVRFDVDLLPAVFTIEEALARTHVIWGADNIFKSYHVETGEVDAAFARAAQVVEGEYTTGAQEQLYIEPQGVIAVANASEGVTVWGSLQCPYYVHKALIPVFGLPKEKIRVVQVETGGGFGGKEEYPSMIACHAALLAWKSGKRVKMIYDRAEDMVATTKRHPSRTRHRTAIDADGKLLAMDIEFVIDGGAYMTLSPVVLSRGTIHSAGPYFCPNVRIQSHAVATNVPPHGAFRGFGAPQSVFALERHLDHVAQAAGLAPDELRRRNFIHEGQRLAVGQIVREKVDMEHLLDRAFALSDYHAKRKSFAAQNPGGRMRRGVGFASFLHGAGFTGSGEEYLASVVGVEATTEGRIRVHAASTEIGQGTNTIFSQIAADALGLPYERVDVVQPDTSNVPNSGPTVASRTAMIVGKLVESAATGIRQALMLDGGLTEDYDADAFAQACGRYIGRFGPLKASSQYAPIPGMRWDDAKYQGDAYGAYAWAVYVAEVSVDTRTYETRVEDFVALQEVGRVLHPVLAAGQIEGGVAQGIGFALYENVIWRDGRMLNSQMTNYVIPTSMDVPPIRVYFEENRYERGPGGAKGIGELPLDGAAPAIVNAIENATGISFTHVPVTPEDFFKAWERSEEQRSV
jgi:CO/xanthine dehydrogenase Mo-binding subunit